MKVTGILMLAAACVGCGTGPGIKAEPPTMPETRPDTIGNLSGTRLRRIDRTGADGSAEFAGWYDSMRDEDCAFRRFAKFGDRLDLCLPAHMEDMSHEAPMFIDATCSLPVALEIQEDGTGRAGTALRRYTFIAVQFSDGSEFVHMFQQGDVLVPAHTTAHVYRLEGPAGADGSCTSSGQQEFRINLVELHDVPLDEFVSWREEVH